MRIQSKIVIMIMILGLGAGCGGAEFGVADAGAHDAASGGDDAGPDAGPGGSDGGVRDGGPRDAAIDAPAHGTCPATPPVNAAPCSGSTLLDCEYGDDPHCRTRARCQPQLDNAYTWFVQPPDPSCAGNPAACPAHFADVTSGTKCSGDATCTYPEGRCACLGCYPITSVDAGPGPEWQCAAWGVPPSCPEPRPPLGSACAVEGQQCDYGAPCCSSIPEDPAMTCTGGVWKERLLACACPAHICQ
jgi:hypothetical protein